MSTRQRHVDEMRRQLEAVAKVKYIRIFLHGIYNEWCRVVITDTTATFTMKVVKNHRNYTGVYVATMPERNYFIALGWARKTAKGKLHAVVV